MCKLIRRLFVAVLLACAAPGAAHAGWCNGTLIGGLLYGFVAVSATSLPFGNYSAANALASQGNLIVTAYCVGGVAGGVLPPFTVALNAGGGSYTQRLMNFGTYSLQYQIYTTAALSTVWGDGTGSTSAIGGGNTGTASQSFTGYGVLPPGQFASPGSYADTITVTITY